MVSSISTENYLSKLPWHRAELWQNATSQLYKVKGQESKSKVKADW